MASQGPNGPSSATTSNANGGTIDWTNPTNCESDDGSYTTAGDGATTGTSYRLLTSSHGFTIPAGATINGVVAEVKRYSGVFGSSGTTDSEVRLNFASGPAGANKADTVTNWPNQGSVAYASYGGSGDLWSSILTPTNVNDSGFGLSVAATITNGTNTANIDYIRVTVYYTAGAASVMQSRVLVFSTPVHPAQIYE